MRTTRETPDPAAWRLLRSSGEPPTPDLVVARAKPFGGAVRTSGGAILLAVRDEHGLASYVVLPDRRHERAVVPALASALGALAEPVESTPDITGAGAVGWLVARPSRAGASRDTQAGANPAEVAVLLAQVMTPGSFVAMSLRAPTPGEQRHARRWFDHRLAGVQTHYSRETEAVVASVFAGASTTDGVCLLLGQLASIIPGFDIETTVAFPGTSGAGAGVVAAGAVVEGAVGLRLHDLAAGDAIGGLVALCGLVIYLGAVPTHRRAICRSLEVGVVPVPARRLVPSRLPRQERVVRTRDGSGNPSSRVVRAREGDYPLAASSFLLAPAMVVGMVSPHAGLASDFAHVQLRRAPAVLLDEIGPLVGTTLAGEPVHLSAQEAWQNCVLFGAPGSGKTALIHHLFAWNCLERTRPSGLAGRPGRRNALVAFEHKGAEGVAGYKHWSDALGDDLLVVELASPDTPAIDLFNFPGSAATRAEFFVSAMRYAYDDTQIQGRSTEVLNAVFTAALACPEEVAMTTCDVIDPPSFVSLAHILLGSRDDARGIALARAMERWAAEHLDTAAGVELADAMARLAIAYGENVTPAQRRNLTEAARNKVDDLMKIPSWWSHSRPVLSWHQILDAHASVVVNAGPTIDGRLLDEGVGQVVSAMLAFSLVDAIKRTCGSWQLADRSVSVFSDELSQFARGSSDVVDWLRNQGRSYGVRLYLATQQPEQLDDKLRSTLLGFGTVFWFQQGNPTVIAQAIQQLSMTGEQWTVADIGNLEAYHAVLRTVAGGRYQSPVTVATSWWGGDPVAFATAQGYPSTASPPPAASAAPGYPVVAAQVPRSSARAVADDHWGGLPVLDERPVPSTSVPDECPVPPTSVAGGGQLDPIDELFAKARSHPPTPPVEGNPAPVFDEDEW
ncbi:MAG: type IV secretory system conjugative DNA transfer family protein [Acidimicrobiales bacterium]